MTSGTIIITVITIGLIFPTQTTGFINIFFTTESINVMSVDEVNNSTANGETTKTTSIVDTSNVHITYRVMTPPTTIVNYNTNHRS